MKKTAAVFLTAATLLAGISMSAVSTDAVTEYKGSKFPFEVEAPSHLALSGMQDTDSDTTLNVSWSMNESMSKWMSDAADSEIRDSVLEKLKKE